MYSYTLAPNLPNSMGGGYFLAYKKLVSSFLSPQKRINNEQPFVSQWGVFYPFTTHTESQPKRCLQQLYDIKVLGWREYLFLTSTFTSASLFTNILHGWREYPHSNIAQTTARLFASANSHPERSPRSLRRRISPAQAKGVVLCS